MVRETVMAGGILILVAAVACQTADSGTKGAPDSVTVTDKDDGGTVQVALGGMLTVRLEAKPGTGYSWKIVRNDARVLQQHGEATFEPIAKKDRGPLVGGPAAQVVAFRALTRGTDILELHYLRQFEKAEQPLRRFSVTVLVK